MKKLAVLLSSLALLSGPGVADDEVSIVSVKRLPLSVAITIAQGAVSACQEKGIQIGATVVDRDGTVQVALRDTIAAPIVLPISKGKAYAAVMFNTSTAELADRANTPIGRAPGVLMSRGGLPIQVAGALLGGIGVSGAPSGETDEECAKAGIDTVLEDLEMAM